MPAILCRKELARAGIQSPKIQRIFHACPKLVLCDIRAPIIHNRTFPCMEANYPYAVKNQRGARNTPSRGYFWFLLVLYGIRLLA